MNLRSGLGLVLVGIVGLPLLPAGAAWQASLQTDATGGSSLIARGGGGRGGGNRGGGGGGNRGGGHSGGAGARTGLSGAGGGLNRGSSRPAGGWSTNASGSRAGGPPSLDGRTGSSTGGGLNRSSVDRPVNRQTLPAAGSSSLRGVRVGTGDRNLGDRNSGDRNLGGLADRNLNVDRNIDRNRNVDRNLNVDRNWNRTVNINNVNLRPGWARPGWGYARPWNYGWYGGWANPTWGWWGARAAVWGIGTLASAAIINNAVDNAINSQQTMIVVPNSNYQLLYGTVQPIGSTGVQFDVTVDGSTYQLTADCQSGLLNGVQPASAAQAELLNAACQVAFGNS